MDALTISTSLRSLPMPSIEFDGAWDGMMRERPVRPRKDILREQDVSTTVYLLLKGYNCRHRLLADGRRQITAIMIPGDICNPEAVIRGRTAYGVQALTSCVLGEIAIDNFRDPQQSSPRLHDRVWRQMVRDQAISHEWLVGLGRRTAQERMAHLFCELWHRLNVVGLVEGDSYAFPLSQAEIADAAGLSTVHVNRVLQQLRRDDLIRWSRGLLTILDRPALEAVAGFDPTYLYVA